MRRLLCGYSITLPVMDVEEEGKRRDESLICSSGCDRCREKGKRGAGEFILLLCLCWLWRSGKGRGEGQSFRGLQ